MLPVEKEHVNTEAHPEGVNAAGWANQETLAGCERTSADEAHETCKRCIRNSNPVSENRLADRIGDAQELSRSWTHAAWRLNFALAALN
jgi:hypothetical protein